MQRYQVLTQNDIAQIHETTLKILEEVGVIFTYEPARELLTKHGARAVSYTHLDGYKRQIFDKEISCEFCPVKQFLLTEKL